MEPQSPARKGAGSACPRLWGASPAAAMAGRRRDAARRTPAALRRVLRAMSIYPFRRVSGGPREPSVPALCRNRVGEKEG